MNALQTFAFDSHAIRVQTDAQGQPWFNANDVCAALELVNSHDAIARHVDADDLGKYEVIDAQGRTQQVNHVNESGLYALIFGSTKEAAKRFKRWVTAEVLPSIRKTGRYSVDGAASAAPPPVCGDHRADHIVSATRIFNAALRAARSMRVPPLRATRDALACALRHTGVDLEHELNLPLPAAPDEDEDELQADRGHAGRFLLALLEGELGFESPPVALGVEVYALYCHWVEAQNAQARAGVPGAQAVQALPLPRFLHILRRKRHVPHRRLRWIRSDGGVAGPHGVLMLDKDATFGQWPEKEALSAHLRRFTREVANYRENMT